MVNNNNMVLNDDILTILNGATEGQITLFVCRYRGLIISSIF